MLGNSSELILAPAPAITREIRALVREMATANPLCGAPRIHGELRTLGVDASERTVSGLLTRLMRPKQVQRKHDRSRSLEAGFATRIMFGSDFPNQLTEGINAIVGAEFLSEPQKADILCNNAARFLRLPAALCVP